MTRLPSFWGRIDTQDLVPGGPASAYVRLRRRGRVDVFDLEEDCPTKKGSWYRGFNRWPMVSH